MIIFYLLCGALGVSLGLLIYSVWADPHRHGHPDDALKDQEMELHMKSFEKKNGANTR